MPRDTEGAMATGAPLPSTDAGVDHVRLAYHYLNTGDADGYASLVDEGAVFTHPAHGPAHGPDGAAALVFACLAGQGPHRADRIIARDSTVVVTGRAEGAPAGRRGFVDVFTLGAYGLLLTWSRLAVDG
ncbi:nuclear transport factor 2 family protein [Nocardiopsis sp. CC223A]|uniref:nuclear transport factor 2 family protein n=1 Tax=Nocardiopsis sp. CC223A TaxID=3044051 RepID=UPI00278BCEC1|nr:nuclear transport factor 2 family protein [Nocardiopsis sp. CC223A]